MALKRLRKEWSLWECKEEANPSTVGKLSELIIKGEREFWTVHPSDDWFCWEAELRPSQGPLQGAHLVYWLRYPTGYPFQPPKFDSSARFVGFPVTWDEVEVGWWIFLIPASSQDGRRLKGRVAQKTAQELKVCFRRGGEDEEGPEESVDKEWWNCHDLVLQCGGRGSPSITERSRRRLLLWHPGCLESEQVLRALFGVPAHRRGGPKRRPEAGAARRDARDVLLQLRRRSLCGIRAQSDGLAFQGAPSLFPRPGSRPALCCC